MIIGNRIYLPSPDDDPDLIDEVVSEDFGKINDWSKNRDMRLDSEIKLSYLCSLLSPFAFWMPHRRNGHFKWCPMHPDNDSIMNEMIAEGCSYPRHSFTIGKVQFPMFRDIERKEIIVLGKGEYQKIVGSQS